MSTLTNTEALKTCSIAYANEREYVTPEVNIFETQDGYVLEAEVPGVAKEGLDIRVEDNHLILVGRRQNDGAIAGATEVYRETSRADYRRVFTLDPAIDTDRTSAKLDQGIVTVTLPKSEHAKPRKISVG